MSGNVQCGPRERVGGELLYWLSMTTSAERDGSIFVGPREVVIVRGAAAPRDRS